MTINELIDAYDPDAEAKNKITVIDEDQHGRVVFEGLLKDFKKSRRKNFHEADVKRWSAFFLLEKTNLFVYVTNIRTKETIQ